MLRKRYIICDIISRRESRKYAQKILRLIKNINIILVKNQLNIIYNDINLELQRDVKKSKNVTIINSFLINLDDNKYK